MLAAESLNIGTAQLLAIFGSDLNAVQHGCNGAIHAVTGDVVPLKTALCLVSSMHPAVDQIPCQIAMVSWLKHVVGADDGHDAKSGFEIGLMLDVFVRDGNFIATADVADQLSRADRWADTMAALKIGRITAPSSPPHASARQWWGLQSWPPHGSSVDGLRIAPDRAKLVEQAVVDRRTGWTPVSHRVFYHRKFREVVRMTLLVGWRIGHTDLEGGVPKLPTELWHVVCRHMLRRHWKPTPARRVLPDV